MRLINITNAIALLECINNVPGNITVVDISSNQRAYSINETGDRFITAVTGIQNCLNEFNVTGSNTYIDVQRTQDTELLDWASQSGDITISHTSRLLVNNGWHERKPASDDRDVNLDRRYLNYQNINLRGYGSGGCDNLMLWNLDDVDALRHKHSVVINTH